MPTSTMTTKGQTVIPKPIREFLGLHPGDSLDFVIQEAGVVVLRPATCDVRELKGCLHRPGRAPVSLAAMDAAVRKRAGGAR